jgi:hypothetical protein
MHKGLYRIASLLLQDYPFEKSEREIAVFCFLSGSDLTRQTALVISTLRLDFFDDIAGKNPVSDTWRHQIRIRWEFWIVVSC